MSSDPLPPIAPARVKALLLPVGRIKADRFESFVDRLHGENVVRLGDVTPDGRPNRSMGSRAPPRAGEDGGGGGGGGERPEQAADKKLLPDMFSPLAFPDGAMLYDLVTHVSPPSHLALTPFDLYREPLAVIALADGREMNDVTFSKRHSANGTSPTVIEKNMRALYQELEDLRDEHPKALVHKVLVFDYATPGDTDIAIPEEGISVVPPVEEYTRTTIKTIMCDISSLLLAEMTTLAKSFEAMTTIESPVQNAARPLNGTPWSPEDGSANSLARRNSQFSMHTSNGRSQSENGLAEKHHARMSMPPTLSRSASTSHSTPVRPSTPVKSGMSKPPMNAEDMPSGAGSAPSSPEQPKAKRPDSIESRDRVSVQGFGPGGVNDRWRLRGKGRSSVVVGSLYLQAGRWSDSLRELQEGAVAARSLNDHIWHGKALELILLNLFLLGWAGMEFQVPAVCMPTQDTPSRVSWPRSESKLATDQPQYLRNLQFVLPDIVDRILNLYSRKRAESEKLPALAFAEATIRLCKALSAVHICGGELDKHSLEMIVTGRLPEKNLTTSPRLTIVPPRQHIVHVLFEAFPASHSMELLTTADRASILSGIANVLGLLGFRRKKAMVIRELVSVLITGLVEARTKGAADAGIHPAAGLIPMMQGTEHRTAGIGLDISESDIEHGVDAFLDLLCRSYGVVGYNPKSISSEGGDSDGSTIARIHDQSSARFFGFPSIKLNILRACINFSEALPDFNGVLKYSSDLLRTSGPGVAPGPRREDVSPMIYAEEQARLTTNIARTYSLAHRLGLDGLAAEYWDEFLVRGLRLEPLPINRVPVPHARSVLPGASAGRASQDVNPFIYNPFLKKPDELVEQYLVADEPVFFRITLQNPYDMEVDIDSIRLETTGAAFEAIPETTRLGPNRTQLLKLKGRAVERGHIKVTGALVQVRGCREKRFPIFSKPWAPSRVAKVKAKGLEALEQNDTLLVPTSPPLQPDILSLTAIPAQPLLSVKSTSLPQSSVMVLEGERKIFSITLQNQSPTPVDFMLFSFKDSTQGPLQVALDNRDATPAELYEYEIILMKKQALRLPNGSQQRNIAPGGEATFDFEILGKPGLTQATIQVDYTHLGVPRDEVTEQFYTRQVSIDLMVTVNASVELARADALPVFGKLPPSLCTRLGADQASLEDYCLLSMDLRNAWPSQMSVHIEGEDGMSLDEEILPGNTTRVVIPIKRMFVNDPHAPIPSLNPSRERQFVVSTTKVPPELERVNRELFWFREKLLERLKATWHTASTPTRSGQVDLRNIRLTTRMVDAIKIEELDINISLISDSGENVAFVDEFSEVKIQVTNRTNNPILPLVRLMPALCHRSLHIALDYTRKLGWDGTLQQLLPLLQGKSSAEFVLGVTPLCRGEFELVATVEEVQVWEGSQDKAEEAQRRPRSDTQTMLEAAVGAKERRMWHSREPFLLTVRDGE